MKAKMIVFPNEDGFSVLVWGKWAEGSMRVRRFNNRTEMVALLQTLRLITTHDALDLENFDFLNSCPLYSAEIEEETLVAHEFQKANQKTV